VQILGYESSPIKIRGLHEFFHRSTFLPYTSLTQSSSASEMTYIVSSGALNSTHSLTQSSLTAIGISRIIIISVSNCLVIQLKQKKRRQNSIQNITNIQTYYAGVLTAVNHK